MVTLKRRITISVLPTDLLKITALTAYATKNYVTFSLLLLRQVF